jgi:hypothetical protein
LDLANELIALSFYDLPVVISQATPFLLGLADELLPVSLHLLAVHYRSSVPVTEQRQ